MGGEKLLTPVFREIFRFKRFGVVLRLRRRDVFWSRSGRMYELCRRKMERHRRCHGGIYVHLLRSGEDERQHRVNRHFDLRQLRRRDVFWRCSGRMYKLSHGEMERLGRSRGMCVLPSWKVQRAI